VTGWLGKPHPEQDRIEGRLRCSADALGLVAQNSAYRFTCPKIFSQTSYLLKDKTEAETLIKGLSKAKTRDKIKS